MELKEAVGTAIGCRWIHRLSRIIDRHLPTRKEKVAPEDRRGKCGTSDSLHTESSWVRGIRD